jgi:hypothetical protein
MCKTGAGKKSEKLAILSQMSYFRETGKVMFEKMFEKCQQLNNVREKNRRNFMKFCAFSRKWKYAFSFQP